MYKKAVVTGLDSTPQQASQDNYLYGPPENHTPAAINPPQKPKPTSPPSLSNSTTLPHNT
jgi:hypothetical protein